MRKTHHHRSSPPKEMRLSIQHPIVQTPLVGLIEEQVEILERLRDPERLGGILQVKELVNRSIE
jgi:hypothetical protein